MVMTCFPAIAAMAALGLVISQFPKHLFLRLLLAHVVGLDVFQHLGRAHGVRDAELLKSCCVLREAFLDGWQMRRMCMFPFRAAGGLGQANCNGLFGGHLLEEVHFQGQVVDRLAHGREQGWFRDSCTRLNVLEGLLNKKITVLKDLHQFVAWNALHELLVRHGQTADHVSVGIVLSPVAQHAACVTDDWWVSTIRLLPPAIGSFPTGYVLPPTYIAQHLKATARESRFNF